jgi:oligosaccharide 4-alpha-D-glucosyltransferase
MLRLLCLPVIFLFSCETPLPYQVAEHQVIFQDGEQTVTIAAITADVIKVQYDGDSIYSDRVYGPILMTNQPFTIVNQENKVILSTTNIEVQVQIAPLSLSFHDKSSGMKLSEEQGYFGRADTLGFRFFLAENEAIYGTGSRAIPMNRRGERFMNYNQPQYGYAYGNAEINYNIPHLYSSKEYMLLIDNPAKAWFDIGSTDEDVLEFSSLGGNMSYYFVNGSSYEELIDEYTDLTGHLGLWQSAFQVRLSQPGGGGSVDRKSTGSGLSD